MQLSILLPGLSLFTARFIKITSLNRNNLHRFRVEGFSLDYLILNICGYTFYGIYSTIGFFTDIKGAGTVLLGDLIFVYHAIPMVIILAIQCVIYPVLIFLIIEGKKQNLTPSINFGSQFMDLNPC